MRIGFSGRLGIYLIVLVFVLDALVLYGPYADTPHPSLWEAVFLFPPFLFPLGLFLLLRSIVVACEEKREAGAESVSVTGEVRTGMHGIGHVMRVARRASKLKQPISNLPSFGLCGALFLAFLCAFGVIINRPYRSKGLMVHHPRAGAYVHSDEPWKEPVVVRIDTGRNLYLNRQPVTFVELDKRLQQALELRGDWTVFVDGNSDLPFGEIAAVVDKIHGAFKAKAVLATPGMAEENAMLSKPPFCMAVPPDGGKLKIPAPLLARYRIAIRRYSYGYAHGRLSLRVSEQGKVSTVKITQSSGYPAIDGWAVRTVQKWQYRPMPGCGATDVHFTFQVGGWNLPSLPSAGHRVFGTVEPSSNFWVGRGKAPHPQRDNEEPVASRSNRSRVSG